MSRLFFFVLILTGSFSLPVSNQHNDADPLAAWLNAKTTFPVQSTFSTGTKIITFPLDIDQNFSGEITLLSAPEHILYQNHHTLPSGKQQFQLPISKTAPGSYLLLLHDFKARRLKTLTLTLP